MKGPSLAQDSMYIHRHGMYTLVLAHDVRIFTHERACACFWPSSSSSTRQTLFGRGAPDILFIFGTYRACVNIIMCAMYDYVCCIFEYVCGLLRAYNRHHAGAVRTSSGARLGCSHAVCERGWRGLGNVSLPLK